MDAASMISQPQVKKENASGEFSSIFLQQMLQQVFKDQGGVFWGGSDEMTPSYSDIFTQQMIKQLAREDAFGFNALIKESVTKRAPVSPDKERMF